LRRVAPISFTEMNGKPLAHPKKSRHGQRDRLRLLANAGITIPDELGAVGRIPPDDIIDAAAAAWSATRIAEGQTKRAGDPIPERRPNHHSGFIWY